jgi:hypothetical protein
MVQQALPEMTAYEKPEIQRSPEMELLQVALTNNAAIDVIERLTALRTEAMVRHGEMAFNQAMNRVQSALGRIAADATNPQTRSKYATYAAIDREIRPIYTKEGFALSFDTEPLPADVEMVRVLCYVSHRDGHTRTYRMDMPADGKGAKGGDVMTKTHARGAATSYAKRYLVNDIFNIAIGEDDNDGNITNGWLAEKLEWIANCRDVTELKRVFSAAYNEAKENKASKAMLALAEAKDKRKAEMEQ